MTFGNAQRLLEYDPITLHPWLTVELAYEELDMQRRRLPYDLSSDPLPPAPDIDFGDARLEHARLMALSLGMQP